MNEEIHNIQPAEPPVIKKTRKKGSERKYYQIHLLLFLLTLFTTLYAGALWEVDEAYLEQFQYSEKLLLYHTYWYALSHLYLGIPFSFTLLGILAAHEMGHYLMCRYHRMEATLPYFIPIPPLPFIGIGTLGAFIKIKSPIPNRKALFDVGVAGPLAGMIVAIPAMFVGLSFSEFHFASPAAAGYQLGEPLIYKAISHLLFGTIPGAIEVHINPMAFAAWLGFLVTFLNLIPIGQLDGGHIAYAVFGKHHMMIGRVMFICLLVFGFTFASMHWFIWALIILVLLGLKHPRPIDIYMRLDFKRKCVAVLALLIFILTFIHTPISVQQGEEITYEEILERSI